MGFVPTMGYLHEGHLSLVRLARKRVGRRGVVVVSVYVNPTQFAPQEDLARYPRDLARDLRLCGAAGVDVVFAPGDREMYPGWKSGRGSWVEEQQLSQRMEGAARPTHFRGVATVVAKLFHLVQPDVAVFGAKDYQQAAVVRRMVEDLRFPLRVVVGPTRREPDGLAMSSRNAYLSAEERPQARALWEALRYARRAVRSVPAGWPAGRLRLALRRKIEARPAARVDYIEFIHPQTLVPVRRVRRGDHLALAVRVGRTRLIDNGRL